MLKRRGPLRGKVSTPTFGPPKTKTSTRTIDISPDTVRLPRDHRREQNMLKMRHRAHYYADHDMVFARTEAEPGGRGLGGPLPVDVLTGRTFKEIIAASAVKRIPFHGLRHTSASLLLEAGEPAKVVQERLGHAKIGITLDTYSHVAPGMQQAAASRLGALLHG